MVILIRYLIVSNQDEHVAQLVEHLTFNQVVVGSIPTVLTIVQTMVFMLLFSIYPLIQPIT